MHPCQPLSLAQGIAVGIATKIPPHNLREVVSGLVALVKDPAITPEGLMRFIPGPDFPTGVGVGALPEMLLGVVGLIRHGPESGGGAFLQRASVQW